MTKFTSEERLKMLASMQLFDSHEYSPMPCPRCGHRMKAYIYDNALSRYMDIYICSNCGTDEALRFLDLPFDEWSFIVSFGGK